MMIKKYVALGIMALLLLGICGMGLGLSQIIERTEVDESHNDDTLQSGEVAEVVLDPDTNQTVVAGEELLFNASAYDEDGELITDYFVDFDWENTKSHGVFYKTETGQYNVTATYEGVTSNKTLVEVVPAEAAKFWIGPEEATINAGGSQEYTAYAEDEFGNEFEVTDDAETKWSDDVDPDYATWEENNIITVNKTGTWEITGEYESFTDTANLTVEPGEVVEFWIVPEEADIVAGESQNYTAYGEDHHGNEINVTDETDWSIDGDAGGEWNQTTGVYTSEFAGRWNITGEYENETQTLSDTANLTVGHADEDHIVISPKDSTITAGESENYTATIYDQFGNEIEDVTNETEWSDNVDPEDYSSWDENNITVNKTGTWEITGEYENETQTFLDTANMIVQPAEAVDFWIEPKEKNITANKTLEYNATAEDEFGNVFDVTEETTWSIDGDAGGEWNQTTGVYTSEFAGRWNITGEYENETQTLSDTANLTVKPAGPDHIEISPEGDTTAAGESVNYTATLYDQFGNEIGDVTNETHWWDDVDPEDASSWDENVITVEEAGEWTITGGYGEFEDTATLEVEPAEAVDFWIEPGVATIGAGESQEYTASAEDEYGNEFDVTGETTWSDDIDESDWIGNEITARTAGDWEITGEYEGLEDTATLQVEHGDADYIEISPEESTITAGEAENYTAIVYDEFDNEIGDVTEETEWSIDEDAGGEWNQTNSVYVYTAEYAGEWAVEAEYEQFQDNATLTVEAAEVYEVIIDPKDDQTINVGEELEFTAEAYDEYGNLIEDDPGEFEWENAPDGVFQEFEAGEYEVRAEYDGVASDKITVNNVSDVKPATILITVILTSVVGIAAFKKIGGGK